MGTLAAKSVVLVPFGRSHSDLLLGSRQTDFAVAKANGLAKSVDGREGREDESFGFQKDLSALVRASLPVKMTGLWGLV